MMKTNRTRSFRNLLLSAFVALGSYLSLVASNGAVLASIGVGTFVVTTEASAHQQKMAITTVLYNPRTQNLEVAHRFNLHDAEHAVKEIFDGSADIYNSQKTQEDFTAYVVERFSIFSFNKKSLPLNLVGSEIEGKHFWVYQETPAPKRLSGVYIEHNALRDIWQKQVNTINIEGMGDIQTLTFSDNTEVLSVEFKSTH